MKKLLVFFTLIVAFATKLAFTNPANINKLADRIVILSDAIRKLSNFYSPARTYFEL